MKVVAFADIPPRVWNILVNESSDAWVFHRSEWIDLESRFGGAFPLSFGIIDHGSLVALQPLYRSQLGLGPFVETLVHSGLHRHTGLTLAPGLDPAKIAAVKSIAMNTIYAAANSCKADRIYLAQQNLAPTSLSSARCEIPFWVLDYGFELGNNFGPAGLAPGPGLATTVVDQIINLHASEDELFAALNESCRRAIRKGINAGLQAVDLSGAPECIDEYWRLAKLSATRSGENLPGRDYYDAIRAAFLNTGIFTALFIKFGDHLAASALLLRDKKACQFFAGVSDPAYLGDRVNDVLHWSIIRHAKKHGDSAYRLGPYFPSVPRGWPIETISRFKSKFGAAPWTIVQGSRYLKPERYRDIAIGHITRLYSEYPTK